MSLPSKMAEIFSLMYHDLSSRDPRQTDRQTGRQTDRQEGVEMTAMYSRQGLGQN